MNTAPTAVTALPPAVPPGPDHLDLTPLLRADGITAVVAVLVVMLIVGVVVAAAHAAAAWSPTGSR